MANYVFNISKGRLAEFANRVDSNDPTNAAFILVPLSATDTEANRQDDDDLTTFLAAAPNEQTGGSWVRKTLTDADLSAPAVDDTNNRYPVTLPAVTWTGPTAGSNTVGLYVGYDSDTTGGTDANLVNGVHLDFNVTADGNDVQLTSGDIFRAS